MINVQKDYTTQKGVPLKLHENKIFSVYFNGDYHYVEFNKAPSGAIVIPRFDNGDFLLVELRRTPVFGNSVEFPRGGVDRRETPEAGARRELVEETGYKVDIDAVTFLGVIGADTATLNGFNHVFLVDIPKDAVPGAFDADEIIRQLRVSPSELRAMVRGNRISCGQSLAAYGLMLAYM